MKAKPIPSLEMLRSVFDYEYKTGALIWLESGNPAGSAHHGGHVSVQFKGQRYQAHRIIWAMCHGTIPENMMIDHIDGNRANNRLDNLRLATDSQNQFNRKANAGRVLKGVYKHKNKWKAEITANKQREYLGLFNTPEAAYKAYMEAAERLHGAYSSV